MGTQTLVSVHLVERDGATGRRLGSARLVHPLVVTLDPDLLGELPTPDDEAPLLRFAIYGFGGQQQPVLEVVDACGPVLNIPAKGKDGTTICGIALARRAQAGPDAVTADLTGNRDDQAAEIMRRLSASQGGSEEMDSLVVGDADPDTANWVCRLFKPPPWFCGEPEPGQEP